MARATREKLGIGYQIEVQYDGRYNPVAVAALRPLAAVAVVLAKQVKHRILVNKLSPSGVKNFGKPESHYTGFFLTGGMWQGLKIRVTAAQLVVIGFSGTSRTAPNKKRPGQITGPAIQNRLKARTAQRTVNEPFLAPSEAEAAGVLSALENHLAQHAMLGDFVIVPNVYGDRGTRDELQSMLLQATGNPVAFVPNTK